MCKSSVIILLFFLIFAFGPQQASAADNKLGEGFAKCNAANQKCWNGCKDAENVDACENVCAINQNVCTNTMINLYGGVALKKHN
jgi:hypothetical protein